MHLDNLEPGAVQELAEEAIYRLLEINLSES